MFGNTIGWVISAIIACIGGYGGYQLLLIAQPTAPSQINGVDWEKATAKPLGLADVATPALLPMTSPKDDAGDLYRQAIADYDAHKTLYVSMQTTREFDESEVAGLKGLDLICQAATCSSMHLFSNHPEEVVGYSSTVDTLDKLGQIALTLSNVILLAESDSPPRYDIAAKYANGLAAMGYNLYKERDAYCELDSGENFLGTGVNALISIDRATHADGKMQLEKALDAQRLQESKDVIQPMHDVLTSLGEQNIATHAGDFFEIAEDRSADRVWRVEAIRRIGRLQFYSDNSADQRKAPKVLKQIAADASEDLVIRTAAAKARDMTSYDNQSQR